MLSHEKRWTEPSLYGAALRDLSSGDRKNLEHFGLQRYIREPPTVRLTPRGATPTLATHGREG